jgi:hypothetical protein
MSTHILPPRANAKKGEAIINVITPDEKSTVQDKPEPAPAAEEIDPVDQNANIEEVEPDLNEELVDYNDAPEFTLDTTKAAKIELRDALAKNGLAMRQVLKEHPIKTYYTSPMLEGTISPEQILLEVPAEDRLNLGLIKDQIIMPLNFFQ